MSLNKMAVLAVWIAFGISSKSKWHYSLNFIWRDTERRSEDIDKDSLKMWEGVTSGWQCYWCCWVQITAGIHAQSHAHISCFTFAPLHSAHVLSFTVNVHKKNGGWVTETKSDTLRKEEKEEGGVWERGEREREREERERKGGKEMLWVSEWKRSLIWI